MKMPIAQIMGMAALAACSPYADEPVATTAPATIVTYQPVVTTAPLYYGVAPGTVYPGTVYQVQAPAPVIVPQSTYVVERVTTDPPRGNGVSVGTSPQPVLTPNQKEQDKTMSSQ
jgi:hypothetical protein